MSGALVLRDIHQSPAPPWWPPAPGWWAVVALLLFAIAIPAWRAWRRRRRHRVFARIFDAALDAAPTPAARVAAMSELLRRAGRRVDPAADKLTGEAWLRFLDAGAGTFLDGPGGLLRDGAYRAAVDERDVAALRPHARARFLAWMDAR